MSVDKQGYIVFLGKELGTVEFKPQDFPDEVYRPIETAAFKKSSVFYKHEVVNRTLFEEISRSEGEVFLLPKVVSFISRVRKEALPSYNLESFELWLNHFAGIGDHEQAVIRGRIVGKYLPRAAYQKLFPIGSGQHFKGPHFSCAHFSPDLDTTIASFHSHLAAFGCRLTTSRHHWIIPGGPPKGSVEIEFLFKKAFGEGVFRALSRTDKEIEISSLDLLSQENIEKRKLTDTYYAAESARTKKATIVVDDQGCFLGDWRHSDIERVHAIITHFWSMMNDHQTALQLGLVSQFAKKGLKKEELKAFTEELLNKKFGDCNGGLETSALHRRTLDKFLKVVVGVKNGYSCLYRELLAALASNFTIAELQSTVVHLSRRPFFDSRGVVIEDREIIFSELEKIVIDQRGALKTLQKRFDTLEIALEIKNKVLEFEPNTLSHLDGLGYIQQQMGDYSYLTVNYQEGDLLFPLGVIHAADLNRKSLATSSWNDFSNPQETDSKPEIELISCVDHHRSDLKTTKPVMGIVMDAQSSNSIFANLLMEINNRYSSGGMSLEQVEKQIEVVSKDLVFPSRIRVLRRLLSRKEVLLKNRDTSFYVSKDREILEYFQCLFAILDDTDLLTKVSVYDVEAMCKLINRLKSLMLGQEVEVVNFDELDHFDPKFVKKAALMLIQTEDLYSLYGILYKAKEEAVESIVSETIRGKETSFFQDTKILGGYASVGQFKHFVKNGPLLAKVGDELKKIWINHARAAHKANSDLKLFIFMLSTISSAEELYKDQQEKPSYRDELWLWHPEECNVSETHLKRFVAVFTDSPMMENEELEFHFTGNSGGLEKLCRDAVSRPFKSVHHKGNECLIVLKVPQKRLVSRKTQIAPYI